MGPDAAAPAPADDTPAASIPSALTEDQLRAVFKATSTFTVDEARDGAIDTPDWLSSADEDDDVNDVDALAGFWSDGEGGDEEEGVERAPRARAPRPRARAPLVRRAGPSRRRPPGRRRRQCRAPTW